MPFASFKELYGSDHSLQPFPPAHVKQTAQRDSFK